MNPQNCPIPSGLEKAYSSKIYFDHRNGRDVVVKCVGAKERQAECFFHSQMAKQGLPAMKVEITNEELVLDFVSGAKTLGDEETPANFEKFGRAVKLMHEITLSAPSVINENGEVQTIKWQDFIKQTIEYGHGRQIQRQGFKKDLSHKIAQKLFSIEFEEPKESVLLHGDLHPNNVLFASNEVIIFDSSDWIIAGDKLYDLALIALNESPENLAGFIKGYGVDFTQAKNFNAYKLLRAFERHPNKFEIQIPQEVEKLLKAL